MNTAYSLTDSTRLLADGYVPSGCELGAPKPPRYQTALAVAALALPLSSSNLRAEQHLAALFPASSTLDSEPQDIHFLGRHTVTAAALPTTAEQLAAVQGFFGLAKTQLAAVCGVQRQTIYDWYGGKFAAERGNAKRLLELNQFVERLKAEGHASLSARLVSRLPSSGRGLLELLTKQDIDEREIGAVVAELAAFGERQRTRGAAAIQKRLGWPERPSESTAETLEANLQDFVDG